MKKILLTFLLAMPLMGADNEIFVDQSSGSSNSNMDLEQLGSGNIIGGIDASAGSMTGLDLDGTAMTLDINQIGDSNKFLGDITADSYTGFFEFDGNSNTFNINTDKTNTFGADSSNVNVDVTGNSNVFTLNHATVALASTLDLDWIISTESLIVKNSKLILIQLNLVCIFAIVLILFLLLLHVLEQINTSYSYPLKPKHQNHLHFS